MQPKARSAPAHKRGANRKELARRERRQNGSPYSCSRDIREDRCQRQTKSAAAARTLSASAH